MDWWQLVLAVLGSSALTAVIKGVIDKKAAERLRENELEDRAVERQDTQQTLQQQFEQFRSEQKRENAEIRQRLAGMESTIHVVNKSMQALIYSDLYKDIMACVKAGRVSAQEKLKLKNRVAAYHDDYGPDTSMDNTVGMLDELRQIVEG